MNPADPEPLQSSQPDAGGMAGWIFGGSFLAMAGAIYLVFYWIPFGGISASATETKAVTYVKQLLLACLSYAEDHAGSFPPNLGVLYPDYMDAPEIFFAEDAKGRDIPTLYYSGFTRISDPDAILIEYPVRYRGKRVIGTVNGRVLKEPVD